MVLFLYAKFLGCQVSCPLSHLLRKCQLSRRESQEAGANRTPAASGYLLRRPARVLLLPSRLAPCHLPQGGRLWFYAQSKLVSPFGRDVAQRQRGLAPSLRELDLPQAKTEGAANYLSRITVLPLHRWRGPPPLSGEAEFGSPERGAVTE